MSFLKSSIIIMRCAFKYKSCFPGVLGYPGLTVVGELCSDDASSLGALMSLTVACPSYKPVSVLVGDHFSLGGIWEWRAVAQISSRVLMETRRILSLAVPWFLCPEGSQWVPLSSSSGHTCAHRLVHSPGRLAFSQVWHMILASLLFLLLCIFPFVIESHCVVLDVFKHT